MNETTITTTVKLAESYKKIWQEILHKITSERMSGGKNFLPKPRPHLLWIPSFLIRSPIRVAEEEIFVWIICYPHQQNFGKLKVIHGIFKM